MEGSKIFLIEIKDDLSNEEIQYIYELEDSIQLRCPFCQNGYEFNKVIFKIQAGFFKNRNLQLIPKFYGHAKQPRLTKINLKRRIKLENLTLSGFETD